MTDRFTECFKRLKQADEGAFVPFVTLCDPNFDISFDILKTLVNAGADGLIPALTALLFNLRINAHYQAEPLLINALSLYQKSEQSIASCRSQFYVIQILLLFAVWKNSTVMLQMQELMPFFLPTSRSKWSISSITF